MVTGAGGRLGLLLRGAFAARPQAGLRLHLCQREKLAQIQWDMLSGPLPDWSPGAIVLHLAGAVRGDEQSLAANAALVAPLVQACRRNRARGLFFVSTAAVYAPGPAAAREDTPPAPASPYGRAKLAAEAALAAADPGCPVTVLRLANVPGADALLGPRPAGQPITLDPVPGQGGGPLRSWIGPMTLAQVLADLARAMAAGRPLPPVLNLAAAPPLPMADLLDASGLDWAYGPPNPNVVPVATLDSTRLQALIPLVAATAAGLIAELRQARP